MNIQQIFDTYASQDVYFQNIANVIFQQKTLDFNKNSIIFFVYHFLDEYESFYPEIDLKQSDNSLQQQKDLQLEPLDNPAISTNNLMAVIYNSKYQDYVAYALTNRIYQTLLAITNISFDQYVQSTQIQRCLVKLDPNNKLQLDTRVLMYFDMNLSHKLNMYDIQDLDDQVILQLLILRKQLKLVFQDKQFNYVYINSQFFAKQYQQIQIQNNLKIKEKQNYFTYIACPKCKQKKCIQLGERQTTLGGDEMSKIVLLCKNPECLHKFKR